MQKVKVIVLLSLGVLVMSPAYSAGGRDGSRLFDRMDSNGDGTITAAESQSQREAMFEKMDANDDGMISAEERDKMKSRVERFRERRDQSAKERALNADTNGDGNVSRDEFMNAPQPLMTEADANNDGNLTREEFSAFIASKRGQR